MSDYPISLENSSEYGLTSPMKMEGPRKNYPCLNLSWDKSYDLPDDGILTVKYHKKRQTDTVTDDSVSQSLELEILSIEDVEAEEPEEVEKTPREAAADALDRYAEEAADEGY